MFDPAIPDYDEWVRSQPESVTADSIWNVSAYRLALYIRTLSWPDSLSITRHRLGGVSRSRTVSRRRVNSGERR